MKPRRANDRRCRSKTRPKAAISSLDDIAASPDTQVFQLSMRTWLAPFDMGVSQDTDIILLPSNEPGLYELQLRLERRSGRNRGLEARQPRVHDRTAQTASGVAHRQTRRCSTNISCAVARISRGQQFPSKSRARWLFKLV